MGRDVKKFLERMYFRNYANMRSVFTFGRLESHSDAVFSVTVSMIFAANAIVSLVLLALARVAPQVANPLVAGGWRYGVVIGAVVMSCFWFVERSLKPLEHQATPAMVAAYRTPTEKRRFLGQLVFFVGMLLVGGLCAFALRYL